MIPIRVSDTAIEDLAHDLDPDRAEAFIRHDLTPALRKLTEIDDPGTVAEPHGPGWRYTDDGITVAGYHLWLTPDPLAAEPGALLLYRISIWPEQWPSD